MCKAKYFEIKASSLPKYNREGRVLIINSLFLFFMLVYLPPNDRLVIVTFPLSPAGNPIFGAALNFLPVN